jgi:hypothetical protein
MGTNYWSVDTGVDERGCVYIMRCGCGCGAIKIGWTSLESRTRRSLLQVGTPHVLEFLGEVDGTAKDEARLHNALHRFRIRGEWYRKEAIPWIENASLRRIAKKASGVPVREVAVRTCQQCGAVGHDARQHR